MCCLSYPDIILGVRISLIPGLGSVCFLAQLWSKIYHIFHIFDVRIFMGLKFRKLRL